MSWENIAIIVIGIATFVTALATFLNSVFDWFRRRLPVRFGFLLNDKIVDQLQVASGDPAKPIHLRLHNFSKTTLTGVVLDMRFLRPLALSATDKALSIIPGKTAHGHIEAENHYWIRHSDLVIPGDDHLNFGVELNTKGISPGTYRVLVKMFTTMEIYKIRETELKITLK